MSRTDCRAGRAFTATCLFALCLAAPERSAAADGELDPTFSTNGWTVEAPSSPAPAVCARCGIPAALDPEYGGYVHAGAEGEPCRDDRGHYADPYG